MIRSLVLAIAGAALLSAAPPGYHVVRRISLGGEGGWDYLAADAGAHRVFLSRASHVIVLDTETGKVAGDIPDTPGVHGIALAPDLNRGFISNGRGNNVTIFDLKTLHVIGKADAGKNPDCIIYDPASKRVFAFNGRSGDATVIDGASGSVVSTIPLGGKPEFATSDGNGRVYVNIEDKSEVVEIDSNKPAALNRWPLAPCEEPSGMAIDAAHHRLFIGCHNKVMAVVDATSGKVIATPPIGSGVDGNAFDPGTGFAFSSNGEGTLTVVGETSPGKFEALENVPTEHGARTVTVDTKTHTLYLPTASYGPPPAPTADNPNPRPSIVKDSFVVLVVSR